MINTFVKHPLSANPDIEIHDILQKFQEESHKKQTIVLGIFAQIRTMIDEREKSLNEELSNVDLQNRKSIEAYQLELKTRYIRLRERRILFQELVANREYTAILRDHENYEAHLARMIQEWSDLKSPHLREYNIEGLDQLVTVVKSSFKQVRLTEQSPYENAQLEQLIVQQQKASILNLNNHGLKDMDMIIIARVLKADPVRRDSFDLLAELMRGCETNLLSFFLHLKKITTLHLGNNQIKAAGAKRIADFLRYNKVRQTPPTLPSLLFICRPSRH